MGRDPKVSNTWCTRQYHLLGEEKTDRRDSLWVGSRARDRTSGGQYSHLYQHFVLPYARLLPQCAVRAAAVGRGHEQRLVTGEVLSVIAFKKLLGTFCHFTKKSKYCVSIEFVTLLHCNVSAAHCDTPPAVILTRTLRGPYKNMS
jgi:hypothetical protein